MRQSATARRVCRYRGPSVCKPADDAVKWQHACRSERKMTLMVLDVSVMAIPRLTMFPTGCVARTNCLILDRQLPGCAKD